MRYYRAIHTTSWVPRDIIQEVLPKLTNLKEIKIRRHFTDCIGNTGLRSLLSRGSNLKKVRLHGLDIDAATAATFGNMEKLEELELHTCSGEISTVLSRASNLKKVILSLVIRNVS